MVISRNVRLLTRSLKSLQHYRHVTRKYATKKPEFISKLKTGKNVWILNNQNIFENLALEDWLYKYEYFQDKNLLLLWRNKPCVVIGRHQNPWAELDVTKAIQSGIEVARRSSGGGTVRARLHQASTSTLRQLCDDTSDSVLIEINGDT